MAHEFPETIRARIRLIAMPSTRQDVAYALRGLRANPGFAALAMATLALGIGAATTMFSVIEIVVMAPFPYRDAGRIAAFDIHNLDDGRPGGRMGLRPDEYLAYRTQNHVFSEDIGGGGTDDVLLTTGEGTEQYDGAVVTPNTFLALGVPAQIGRVLTPEDGKPGAQPVFVMAYKMWQRRYHLDPSILGRSFILNGKPTTLVGIMPKRFTKRGADLWFAAELDPTDKSQNFVFQAWLKPGVTLQQAQADLLPIAQRWSKDHPKDYPKRFTIEVTSYADSVVGSFKKTLYTLGAAVGLLLLIACVNVANMLLARATARDREMAIRAALGASRWRITRQLLVESLLLALGGAALGIALAFGGTRALTAFIPDGAIPKEAEIGLNPPVLLFCVAAAFVTALLFGLAPALQFTRGNIVEPLKDSGRGATGGFRRARLRSALVVVELALSLVLLTGAGLMIRTFAALQIVDLGFNPSNILVARLPFPHGQYKTSAEKQRFFGTLLPRVKALPGVVDATETSTLPPYGGIRSEIDIPGKVHTDRWESIFQLVSEGYFHTLGARLVRGRLLNESEVAGARKLAVVNETLVTKYFGHENPIGQQIRIKFLETMPDSPVSNASFEIVGVLADMKNQGLQDPIRPEMMIPYTVTGNFERGILVRTAGNPMPLLDPVRRQIWAVDHNVALTMTRTLEDFLSDFSYSQPRFVLLVLGVFAGIALALVAIGVYSVIAYTVSRQTREIGIRMALGAGEGDVLSMVFRMGALLVAIGLACGLGASFAVNRVLASELWGVSPHDPTTFVAVSAVVIAAGAVACWFPARRAARVDPLVALRFE
jgi:putative ABC transport system permease protein